MHLLAVLSLALACVAANASQEAVAKIVKADFEIKPDNSYNWSYETENGINAVEQGNLKQVNGENPIIEAKGGFRYPSPNGPIELTYVANEYGFQPQGDHLPVSPPIPEAIIRSIEFIRTHTPKQQ